MKLINLLLLFVLASCSRSIIDTNLKIGTGSPANTTIESNQGLANNPKIKYDFTTGFWQFSNDGVGFNDFASSSDLSDYVLTIDLNTTLTGYVDLTSSQTISGAKSFTGQFITTSTTNGNRPCPVMLESERDAIASPSEGDCIINSNTSNLNFYLSGAWGEISGGGSSGGGGVPLLTKGALLTSDGFTNGEFVCLDNEILVWDGLEAAGVKCEAKENSDIVVFTNGTSTLIDATNPGVDVSIPSLDTVITTNFSSNPVEITVAAKMSMFGLVTGGTESDLNIPGCEFATFRDNVEIGTVQCNYTGRTTSLGDFYIDCSMPSLVDFNAPQGTPVTYSFKWRLKSYPPINSFDFIACRLRGTLDTMSITARQVKEAI